MSLTRIFHKALSTSLISVAALSSTAYCASVSSVVVPAASMVSIALDGSVAPTGGGLLDGSIIGSGTLVTRVLSVSYDGRFVAFIGTWAGITPDLAGTDPEAYHLYVKDTLTGAITHIDSSDSVSNAHPLGLSSVVISGNGEWIAYSKNHSASEGGGTLTLYQRRTGIKQQYQGLAADDIVSDVSLSYDGSVLAFSTISASSFTGVQASNVYQYTIHAITSASNLSSGSEKKITKFSSSSYSVSYNDGAAQPKPGFVKTEVSANGASLAFYVLGGTFHSYHDFFYADKYLSTVHQVPLTDLFAWGWYGAPVSQVFMTPDGQFAVVAGGAGGGSGGGFLSVSTQTGQTFQGNRPPIGLVGNYLWLQDRDYSFSTINLSSQQVAPVDARGLGLGKVLSGDGSHFIYTTSDALSPNDTNQSSDLYSEKIPSSIQIDQPDVKLNASYTPSVVSRGGRSTFSMVLTNPSTIQPHTNVAFTYSAPPNTVIAVAPTGSCLGLNTNVNYSSTGTTVSGISIPAGGSCSLQMSVFSKITLGTWTGVFSNLDGVTVEVNPSLTVR